MNVKDAPLTDYPETCWLEAIFKRQRDLMNKYHEIEEKNGLLICKDIPVNLHDRFGQARLKDFAWRFTEEIAESMEILITGNYGELSNDTRWHFMEEQIDALHFLTELSILSGFPITEVESSNLHYPQGRLTKLLGDVPPHFITNNHLAQEGMKVITFLGMAMNCLKNKPWKQTHMETDVAAFMICLKWTWTKMGRLLRFSGFDEKMIYDIYMRKSEVNKFRQRSNY